jgi:hypothetical protein
MIYMLMICYDPTKPPPKGSNLQPEHAKLEAAMREQGHYVSGAALWPFEGATRIVRPDGDRRLVLDGPFPETREVVGGYFMVDCSEDDALEYAKRISLDDRSWVQVRRVPLWHPA